MSETSELTILEGELKQRIKDGEKFKLILEYDPTINQYALHAKGARKKFEIHTFRGGIRMMRDPHRAMTWAESTGMTGVELDHSFA
ncbi:MAG: hypothetical protein AAF465_13630 [Pseudomonadota bacterium]